MILLDVPAETVDATLERLSSSSSPKTPGRLASESLTGVWLHGPQAAAVPEGVGKVVITRRGPAITTRRPV
jgi:hypothetical protein